MSALVESTLDLKENQLPTLHKGISSLSVDHTTTMDETKGRVSLQTLQPSARVKGLVGPHGQIVHPAKEVLKSKRSNVGKVPTPPSTGKLHIFEDESRGMELKKNKSEDKGIQTETSELDDFKSLTSDEISIDYYSTLAERRRLALAEALAENEGLHRTVDNLKSEIDALKAENSLLKPLAEEAQYLAGVLKNLVGSADDGEEEPAAAEEENAAAADGETSDSK